jgi:hypothetical protein
LIGGTIGYGGGITFLRIDVISGQPTF